MECPDELLVVSDGALHVLNELLILLDFVLICIVVSLQLILAWRVLDQLLLLSGDVLTEISGLCLVLNEFVFELLQNKIDEIQIFKIKTYFDIFLISR